MSDGKHGRQAVGVNGWLMLAMLLNSPTTEPWRPEWSDTLDRAILRERARQPVLAPFARPVRGRTVCPEPGIPRGEASREEVARRHAAERALGRTPPPPTARNTNRRERSEPWPSEWPSPRRQPSGWLASFRHAGESYRKRFPTEQEARTYIRTVKQGGK